MRCYSFRCVCVCARNAHCVFDRESEKGREGVRERRGGERGREKEGERERERERERENAHVVFV